MLRYGEVCARWIAAMRSANAQRAECVYKLYSRKYFSPTQNATTKTTKRKTTPQFIVWVTKSNNKMSTSNPNEVVIRLVIVGDSGMLTQHHAIAPPRNTTQHKATQSHNMYTRPHPRTAHHARSTQHAKQSHATQKSSTCNSIQHTQHATRNTQHATRNTQHQYKRKTHSYYSQFVLATGKTSLLLRYVDNKFDPSFISTIGYVWKTKEKINGEMKGR